MQVPSAEADAASLLLGDISIEDTGPLCSFKAASSNWLLLVSFHTLILIKQSKLSLMKH